MPPADADPLPKPHLTAPDAPGGKVPQLGLEPAAPDETAQLVTPLSPAHTFFAGGIFILALLTALYFSYEISIPIVLAFVTKLVLQPVIRIFEKLKLPRSLTAIVIIAVLLGAFIGLGTVLYKPAVLWAERLPAGIPKLEERLTFLSKPIETVQKFLIHAETVTELEPKVMPVAIEGNRLSDKVLHSTRAIVGGLFTTLLVLYFFILSGDTFLRRLVEILPRFKDKRQAVDISQQIEHDISAYLRTITLVNLCLGVAMGGIMEVYGAGDAVLWGTLAFLLNYIPIVGPLIGIAVFVLVGLLDQPDLTTAMLPAAFYVTFHVIESNFLTPSLLARRFTLNPVLVVISLIFWFWMWGVPGAILATPILAITKIICDKIQKFAPFGHFLEA